MNIYNRHYLSELSRNARERASYQNIFEINNIIQNLKDQFNLDLAKKNPIIQSYKNKKIKIYNVNNNLNSLLINNNKNTNNTNPIRVYRSKRISSSYFAKIKNIYSPKTPTLLSEKILNINKKPIIKRNNKNKINNNYYLPKISNSRKDLIQHVLNKKLNLISLENINSYSFGRNDLLSNKIKLPRVKSTIIYDKKDLNKRLFCRNKKITRCNSSINKSNKSNKSVKSIYMSFGLAPKNKLNLNCFNKIVLLKRQHKKNNINSEEKKSITHDIEPKKLNYMLIDDFKLINKDKNNIKTKEKGKEYKFNQNFKKVINYNLNSDNDNMLLNDKGTLIGSFFN